MAPSPNSFIINICVVYMNVFARFDAIPSMTLQDTGELRYVKLAYLENPTVSK